MSGLFNQTLRRAEAESHRLLLRAGFIRQWASGLFSYVPLGKRSIVKIEDTMHDEITAIGGQEMPV